jgi:hypothetical protein
MAEGLSNAFINPDNAHTSNDGQNVTNSSNVGAKYESGIDVSGESSDVGAQHAATCMRVSVRASDGFDGSAEYESGTDVSEESSGVGAHAGCSHLHAGECAS